MARIAGVNIPTNKRVLIALQYIHGIGQRNAAEIIQKVNIPEDRRVFRLLTVMENLRTGLDRSGVTDARKHELLDKVFAYFPVLGERRNQADPSQPSDQIDVNQQK